jgi:hypothetical protein
VILPGSVACDRKAILIPLNSTKEDSMRRVVAASALLFAFATGAEARTHHQHYRHYAHRHYVHYAHYRHRQFAEGYGDSGFTGFGFSSFEQSSYQRSPYQRVSYGRSGLGGRPVAWCGWYMRSQVGADPGPEYNLARSWAHYGSNAGGPSVGTIVVWSHHVGKIVGQENGQWIVESGNDGHTVRTRPRSLAGAIAFRRA